MEDREYTISLLKDELDELEELTSYQLDMLKDELDAPNPKP